jgi:N-acetylneuraminic acid mutarotase
MNFKKILKKAVSLLLIVFFAIPWQYFILVKPVEAASYTITKRIDFDNGYYNNVESKSKEGEIKLAPAGSWGPRAFKTPNVTLGNQSAIASDGSYVYVLASNDDYFARYLPSENRWQTLSRAPKFSYPGAQLVYLNGYLYAVFGGYQKEFYRYSIAKNLWEKKANMPDLVYDGTACATDGTNIYCLRGTYSTDFWMYSPQSDSWAVKSSPPASIAYGAGLVYYNGNFYALRGYGTNTMYRYNISSNTWYTTTTGGSALAGVPGTLGTNHTITLRNNEIFVTRDGGTNSFYKYNITSNSWTTLTNTPQVTYYVGCVYNSSDDTIYVFRGNGTYDFWKYNPTTNSFAGPADLPNTAGSGADLIYYNGYLYYLRGNNSANFYRFNISGNSWTTLTSAPGSLNDDTKGVKAGNYLYFFQGGGSRNFYRYDLVGGSWSTMTNLTPATVGYGATLVYPGSGDYIYATRGYLTRTFWRYTISTDTWDDASAADLPDDAEAGYGARLITDGTDIYYLGGSTISTFLKYSIASNSWTVLGRVPFAPYWGTDCAYYSGKIYCQAGYYKSEFWEYTIASNSWRRLPDIQTSYAYEAGPYNGGSLEVDPINGIFYSIPGQGLSWIHQYTPSAYNYQASGSWTSSTLDLFYVYSWTSLVATTSTPSDSLVSFETRSSTDGESWSSWQAVSGTTIQSSAARYLQIRANFSASSDRSQTPVLYDLTINYTGDQNPPTNPSSFTGKSQQVGGVNLTSGQSYPYPNPYFSWEGASDSETGVEGYYVYFGSNASADPQISGSFQTTTSYIVTTPLTHGTTYYLRLKTKDMAGNISSAITGFTYTYTGVSPPQTITKTATSDFSSGTTSNVSTLNDEIKLASKSGFWQQQRLSLTPASIYAGGKLAYVSSTGKLYTFQGNNTNTFYEYNIATDTWTQKANAPSSVYWGGGVVEGPPGYLYGWPGNNSNKFWLYDISANSWSDAAASDAPATLSYGTDAIFDGSRYLYVLRGNGDDAFYRYDTQTDTWENLANTDFGAPNNQVDNLAYNGSDLAYDGLDTIYAIQGNARSGFAAYSIQSNSWTFLPNLPVLANYGANIEYDPTSNAIYLFSGWDRPFFYKYDIANQSWQRLSDAPAGLGYGASVRNVSGNLYVLRGAYTQTFWKYNIAKSSWLLPNVGLFGGFFRGGDYRTFNYGADIVKGDGDNFYITLGNYDNLFIRYNASTGEVTQLANAPAGFYVGGDLVYDSTNNKIYATPSLYYRKLFVYDISTDTWSEETSDPPPYDSAEGSVMVYDGNHYIYWLRGGSNTTFYRFDTQGSPGSKWQTLASTPGGMSYGADMVIRGNYIYALRGGNTISFYRYDISGNSWSDPAVADLPTGKTVYNDGFLVDGGGDYLYACRGGNSNECFRYSISNNSWTQIANAPAQIYQGGAAAVYNNKIYVIAGSGTNTWADGLYTYVMQTNTTSFEESGSYVSEAIDLGAAYKYANLSLTYNSASNTNLTVYTSSSNDNSSWSDWAQASELKTVGNQYMYQIKSSPSRYLKVKFVLTSSDGVYSGVISDYSITYYQDTTPPTNPTSLNAYSSATKSATIGTNTWYNFSSPYFDWPEPGETGGANDGAGGSGVSGYYVYFGTDSSADPQTDGTYQTSSDYTASSLTSGETYYLRIKTKDDAGNVSTGTWQPFVYKFDNTPPVNPTTITVNPPGYTNTNQFTFAWSGATDLASLVKEYCYKTGAPGSVETCTTEASASGSLAYQTGTNTFYLRTKDNAGNYSTSYMTATFYYSSVAPGAVRNLRVIYPVGTSSNTVNEFAFAWDPPELYYGQQSGLRYYYSVNALPTANNVIGPLSSSYVSRDSYATQKGLNRFYVVTKDEAGNIDYNVYSSVEFTANTTAPGVPRNLDISDISIKETSSWRLALSWDEPVSTGSGVAYYKVYRYDSPTAASSSAGLTNCQDNFSDFSYIASTSQTSYVDTGLTQTRKYYCIKACDSTNECSAVSDTISMYPDGRWRTAPTLVASPSATVKTKTATITWSTNRTSNSFVKYGKSSGSYGEETGSSDQVAYHVVNLIGLEPGTTYYYKALWTDEDGNTGQSDELTFTTNPAPYVSNVKFNNVNINSAYVIFTIKNAVQATIEYGTTVNYGKSQSLSTSTAESTYTVQLTDLTEDTLYHLRIAGKDEEGNVYYSDDYTFQTLPTPKITNLKIQQVVGLPTATLRILWQTNALTTTVVNYYPTSLPEAAKDYINLVLKNKHDVLLKDLKDNTEYTLIIKGKDSIGNETVPVTQKLKTVADIRPPEIQNMEVESTVTGVGDDAKAQIIVSWDTDEPATTQVEYNLGTGTTYGQATSEDSSLTSNHSVTITGLRPGQIYHLRAVSKDKAGNIGYSYDTVIVTPKATKDALTIVVENLSKTFGFLKKVIK